MKKYINAMLLLSIAGTLLSGLLLYQHYFPDFEMGFLSCGKGFSNPCISVGQSKYSTILGIPVAAFGLLYFSFITFLVLIADYAQDKYYKMLSGILFSLTAAGVFADIIFGFLLIKIGEMCTLCVWTYLINIALFVLTVFYIRTNFDKSEIKESVKNFFKPSDPDEKASLSLSILFVFFLIFSIFAATNIIKMKSGVGKTSTPEQKAKLITGFYNQKLEQVSFPKSTLVIGNPDAKLKIHIINDFLCSACYKLYQIEKYIITKYRNKIQIVYYHYPLDNSCNKYMDDAVYHNSCLASQSMYAAAEAGFFEEYFYSHFSEYNSYKDGFEKENIAVILKSAETKFSLKKGAIQKFTSLLDSNSGSGQISGHIEFCEKIKIEATPSLFIAGRRIVGVPPKELLEGIIDIELSK
jgi:uncharacterized membrane protein/protein-disulfide isomerase